ncbi:LPS export ABC transporter permease LptF [Maridesulfovibrio hydrothermalis]|uniref:Permease YjgP/YjgQ family protein n=1 Tax=Maridesulfovibrio hydrothermalis AM13 = DSM 14728 TaxID=1121451 RepID=L0RD11_9BACT|nr:LPS export ABC transporter permease LptF [Maridesulfovibrio hydrothermalis]CCO24644.1 Permease YjgP/YjgQ family protein [Maridesulfovibrio hydrothermalis AM13 = DSM 14728]
MKLLHRQIFKELISIFTLSISGFMGLILIGRLLQFRDLFMGQSIGILDMAKLFMYLCPFFLLILTPIATMLAIFLTFLRMNADNEITALKSGGLSLYRLLPAPIIFCLLCTGADIFFSMYGLSWGTENFRNALMEFARTQSQLAMQPGVFNRDFPGLVFYAEKVDDKNGVMHSVFVRDSTRKGMTATIVAPLGEIRTDPAHGRLLIHLENGRIYQQEKEQLSVLKFKNYDVRIPLANILQGYDVDELRPKEMSWEKLVRISRGGDRAGEIDPRFIRKVDVEIQKRLALPVACLVLGMFAMPIACIFRGMKQQYGLIISMGLFLVYYTMLSLGVTFGESGTLTPVIGLWLPNVSFAIVSGILLKMAVMEHSFSFSFLKIFRRKAA